MSRRSEIDVEVMDMRLDYTDGDAFTEMIKIAKSLADEIDVLRAQLAAFAAINPPENEP